MDETKIEANWEYDDNQLKYAVALSPILKEQMTQEDSESRKTLVVSEIHYFLEHNDNQEVLENLRTTEDMMISSEIPPEMPVLTLWITWYKPRQNWLIFLEYDWENYWQERVSIVDPKTLAFEIGGIQKHQDN